MTMTIDSNQQRLPLSFDHMSSYQTSQPHFTNPWVASSAAPPSASHAMYASSQPGLGSNSLSLDNMKQHHHQQQQQQPQQQQQSTSRVGTGASMASYGTIPVTTASAGSPHKLTEHMYGGQQDLLSVPQDLSSFNRLPLPSTGPSYAESAYSAASPIHSTYAASPTPFDQLGYAPAPMRSTYALTSAEALPSVDQRRYSNPSLHNDDRKSFADAIEASHGILSLSQETPRPVYGSRTRGSGDSYGFPSAHSTSSSVSSSGGYSGYYGGSIDSSVSDYSTAGSDIESVASRTLPRPQGLMSTHPPAPQSMMGSFSSKVSSSTQKKHKCKVCDKRFTRPSSLQTHMYSHTGEKPFQCEVEGCGRHFSVVSNLRRHRKVHKGQTPSEADSEDHESSQHSGDD